MTNFWKNKKVLVTGGAGFIGSYVSEQLLKKGAKVAITTRSGNLINVSPIINKIKVIMADLTKLESAINATKGFDIVLNLASKVAGIQFNINHPATMFKDNFQIAQNITEASLINKVERLMLTSSACVYARNCTIPTPEEEGFLDDPEPTNLGYGWAKRAEELIGRFYHQEYGMKIALPRPYNAYGPRDDFNPETSHVIPGIIKRIFDGENPLVVWGSGKQTRSFLFVEDFARGLLEVTEKYAIADPINIGTEEEVTIGDLARMIVDISGKDIKIKFDPTKPDGQPRRNCDTRRAKLKIGYKADVKLKEGLLKTIRWYKEKYTEG